MGWLVASLENVHVLICVVDRIKNIARARGTQNRQRENVTCTRHTIVRGLVARVSLGMPACLYLSVYACSKIKRAIALVCEQQAVNNKSLITSIVQEQKGSRYGVRVHASLV